MDKKTASAITRLGAKQLAVALAPAVKKLVKHGQKAPEKPKATAVKEAQDIASILAALKNVDPKILATIAGTLGSGAAGFLPRRSFGDALMAAIAGGGLTYGGASMLGVGGDNKPKPKPNPDLFLNPEREMEGRPFGSSDLNIEHIEKGLPENPALLELGRRATNYPEGDIRYPGKSPNLQF